MKRALFTSARTGTGNDHWCTPPVILDRVRQVGPIGLDPCSNAQSIVGARLSFTEKGNGLAKPWTVRTGEVAYVNPPYSALREWCTKCVGEGAAIIVEHGHLILLIPARTDTVAWHTAAPHSTRILLLKGRLEFIGAKQGATFPSALLYWGREPEAFEAAFGELGMIINPRTAARVA